MEKLPQIMHQIAVKAEMKMYIIKIIFKDTFLVFLWEKLIQWVEHQGKTDNTPL